MVIRQQVKRALAEVKSHRAQLQLAVVLVLFADFKLKTATLKVLVESLVAFHATRSLLAETTCAALRVPLSTFPGETAAKSLLICSMSELQ